MTETFTKNDLVKFLYDESGQIEKELITRALIEDSLFQAEMDDFQQLVGDIDHAFYKAPKHTVEEILAFSRASAMESV